MDDDLAGLLAGSVLDSESLDSDDSSLDSLSSDLDDSESALSDLNLPGSDSLSRATASSLLSSNGDDDLAGSGTSSDSGSVNLDDS